MGIKFKNDINLSEFSTFKIGGNAKYFFEAKNQKDLVEAVKEANNADLAFFILGGGSNVLFADEGYDGVIIKIKNQISSIEKICRSGDSQSKCLIYADAGVLLKDLVGYCIENGLAGLEWAAGIPGTVGGAIRGNAGAYGGQMADVIYGVNVFDIKYQILNIKKTNRKSRIGDPIAMIQRFDHSNCNFEYRGSIFKQDSNLIILSAELKFQQGNKEEIKRKVRDTLEKRAKSLGKCYPSAGCVFKNPQTDNAELIKMFKEEKGVKIRDGKIPAGYLIEKIGLKGAQIGGAVVSKNNANFILNENNATARDVIEIVDLIKGKVRREFEVELELEIQIIDLQK